MLEDFKYSALSNFQDQLTIMNNVHANQLSEHQEYAKRIEKQALEIIAQRDSVINEQSELITNNQETIHELAKRNRQLQEAMAAQQKMMEEWMTSQKAFQALAIKYGHKLGLNDEQRKLNLEAAKEQVISGTNPRDVKLEHE